MSADIEKSATKPILSEMYTNALLLLVTSLIQLEDCIRSVKEEHQNDCLPKEFEQMNFDETLSLKMEVLFLSGQPIIYQPIFLEAIIYSLKSSNNEQMHYIWINFVQNLLPYFSKASIKILTSIILRLCSNLEHFENAATKRFLKEFIVIVYISSRLEIIRCWKYIQNGNHENTPLFCDSLLNNNLIVGEFYYVVTILFLNFLSRYLQALI